MIKTLFSGEKPDSPPIRTLRLITLQCTSIRLTFFEQFLKTFFVATKGDGGDLAHEKHQYGGAG